MRYIQSLFTVADFAYIVIKQSVRVPPDLVGRLARALLLTETMNSKLCLDKFEMKCTGKPHPNGCVSHVPWERNDTKHILFFLGSFVFLWSAVESGEVQMCRDFDECRTLRHRHLQFLGCGNAHNVRHAGSSWQPSNEDNHHRDRTLHRC